MTDPLDLEALNKRAREISGRYSAESVVEMEGLCARAIEIAEQEHVERKLAHVSTKVLDDELAQARRDVLRLRKALRHLGWGWPPHPQAIRDDIVLGALEDTNHYEQQNLEAPSE